MRRWKYPSYVKDMSIVFLNWRSIIGVQIWKSPLNGRERQITANGPPSCNLKRELYIFMVHPPCKGWNVTLTFRVPHLLGFRDHIICQYCSMFWANILPNKHTNLHTEIIIGQHKPTRSFIRYEDYAKTKSSIIFPKWFFTLFILN